MRSIPKILKPSYHSVEKHLSKIQTLAKCENVKTEWLIEPHSKGRGRVRLLVFPVGEMCV